MRIRVSAGTAAVLGLRPGGGGEVAPTTAYLLLGESCPRSCGFCAQARGSTAGKGKLSRVTWPEFELESVLGALAARTSVPSHGGGEGSSDKSLADAAGACIGPGILQRICVQTVAGTESSGQLAELLPGIRSATAAPVSASVYVRSLDQLERLFSAGLTRAGLALDAASPDVYRQVKGGSLVEAKAFLEEAAAAYPDRISTHLIAGLGETEEEMLSAVQWCADRGITAGLFAFTPVRGTGLALRPPPELASYRRIQAAARLITTGRLRLDGMAFDGLGRLAGLGLSLGEIKEFLLGGLAFRTAGCPGCNRPYYNERPGQIPYNYPGPLTPEQEKLAIEPVLALAFDARGVQSAAPGAARRTPGGDNR